MSDEEVKFRTELVWVMILPYLTNLWTKLSQNN